VVVTKEAEALRDAIVNDKAAPITYNSPKPKEILEEDKIIERFPVPVKPEAVRIRAVEQVFD
jgi:zinc protease